MRHLVSAQGRLCIDFRCSVMDPLRVAGFSDAPGSVRGILGSGLAEQSHKSCFIPVGVAWKFLPHCRRCIDSRSGSQTASSQVGCASIRWALRRSSGRNAGAASIFSLQSHAVSFPFGMQ
ncbi:hypothetical protein NDU88_001984 [Pleurodeles waltl]|uniref:Uncharacterized protein n=1 Tax=Pleurodeles waltl TaxID=8319 RepID=A0AAV7V9B3_PLEWA|nr:hypothetical protein NDU88_001984 [Pleurodeles waltl]